MTDKSKGEKSRRAEKLKPASCESSMLAGESPFWTYFVVIVSPPLDRSSDEWEACRDNEPIKDEADRHVPWTQNAFPPCNVARRLNIIEN